MLVKDRISSSTTLPCCWVHNNHTNMRIKNAPHLCDSSQASHLPLWNPRDARSQEEFYILSCTLRDSETKSSSEDICHKPRFFPGAEGSCSLGFSVIHTLCILLFHPTLAEYSPSLGVDGRACIIILFLVFANVTDTDRESHVLTGKISFL